MKSRIDRAADLRRLRKVDPALARFIYRGFNPRQRTFFGIYNGIVKFMHFENILEREIG